MPAKVLLGAFMSPMTLSISKRKKKMMRGQRTPLSTLLIAIEGSSCSRRVRCLWRCEGERDCLCMPNADAPHASSISAECGRLSHCSGYRDYSNITRSSGDSWKSTLSSTTLLVSHEDLCKAPRLLLFPQSSHQSVEAANEASSLHLPDPILPPRIALGPGTAFHVAPPYDP